MGTQDIYRRSLLLIGGHDLPIAGLAVFVWAGVLEVADWRVLSALMVLRVAAWVGVATRLLAPIRRWQARRDSAAVDEAELLAVDRAFRSFEARFLSAYVLAWLACVGGAMALGAAAVPTQLPVGRADRTIGLLLLVVLVIAELLSTRPLLERLLSDAHRELVRELHRRGQEPPRRSAPLARRLLTVIGGLLFAVVVVLCALWGRIHVEDQRGQELERQLRRAQVGALELDAGRGLGPGLELVGGAELPEPLGFDPKHDEEVELLGVVDAPRGRVLAAAPVGDGRWVLAEAAPDEDLGLILIFLVIAGGVGAVPVLVTMLPLVRSVTGPLDELDRLMTRVVDEGEVFELERVVALRDDELGRLVDKFNGMLDLLDELGSVAAVVAKGDLRVRFERPGDLQDAFRGMLERLREVVAQIRTIAVELAQAGGEIQAVTQEQEQAVEAQSLRMQEISETVISLAIASGDITKRTSEVLDNAEQAAETTDETAARILELNREATGIGELLDRIRGIADRSDLLALNGSLEATRAGEAGRGFALVAAETRRLAERVNDTVTDMRALLENIAQASASTANSTEASRKLAQDTAEAARTISEVTGRQDSDTMVVSAAMQEVVAGVAATATAATQTRSTAEGLKVQAERLEALTRRFETDEG